jgi:hypothetical protein
MVGSRSALTVLRFHGEMKNSTVYFPPSSATTLPIPKLADSTKQPINFDFRIPSGMPAGWPLTPALKFD